MYAASEQYDCHQSIKCGKRISIYIHMESAILNEIIIAEP